MPKNFPFRLYLVLTQKYCKKDWLWVAEEAIKGGVDVIQLREKEQSFTDFLHQAKLLQSITSQYHIPLIINDNIHIAKAIGAEGVHLGLSDTPPSKVRLEYPQCQYVGYSIEYIDQMFQQEIEFADCLGISPVFKTATKTNTVTEWGLEGIQKIRRSTDKSLVAIGHISTENCAAVIRAGADCVAVVSAICASANPGIAAEKLRNQIEKSV